MWEKKEGKNIMIRIYEVGERTENIIQRFTEIWESSVRATHLFLTDAEVERIKGYVPQALKNVESLTAAENEIGETVGFMGTENGRLEMLFLLAEERGNGTGRMLLEYGIKMYGINELTVNEQNPQAVGFYEHMGFEVYKRTEHDEEGGPYPLLYMRLRKGGI